MNSRSMRITLLLAAAAGSSAASAHDFFLLPEQFHAQAPGDLNVEATVGSSFPTPEIVVTPDRIAELYAKGSANPRISVAGGGAKSLNLKLSARGRGLVVAGVRTLPRDVEYGEDRIGPILEEYRVGRDALAAIERLSRPRTLRVTSRRFAKTLVCVQRCDNPAAAGQPLGAELEFVGGGANDHFRLLRAGRPLADYPVDIVSQDGKRRHLSTDARGEIHVPADAKGKLMLFAAVMTPPSGSGRFTLDLTSLTFERR